MNLVDKKYVIEQPQPAQAEAVVVLQDVTWLATYVNDELNITKEDILSRQNNFSERVEQRRKSFSSLTEKQFIVKNGDEIIAWLSLEISPTKNDINALYVLPEFQNQGIGTMLIQKAFAELNPSRPIHLTVATYNTKAILFYTKFGFKIAGDYKRQQPIKLNGKVIPELLMELRIKNT